MDSQLIAAYSFSLVTTENIQIHSFLTYIQTLIKTFHPILFQFLVNRITVEINQNKIYGFYHNNWHFLYILPHCCNKNVHYTNVSKVT